MRKLRFKTFGGILKDEKLADFINENNIKQEDILQIVCKTGNGDFSLFYYTKE